MNYNSTLAFLIMLLVVILIIKALFGFGKRKEYMDSSTESESESESELLNVLTSTDLEAFKNLSSMFANGKVLLPDLEVQGDLSVTGSTTLPSLSSDSINSASGSGITVSDTLNVNTLSNLETINGSSDASNITVNKKLSLGSNGIEAKFFAIPGAQTFSDENDGTFNGYGGVLYLLDSSTTSDLDSAPGGRFTAMGENEFRTKIRNAGYDATLLGYTDDGNGDISSRTDCGCSV